MDKEQLEILADAVRTRQRKEDIERSVGRAARRADKSFEFYVEMVSELRELAKSKTVTVEEAASHLLADYEKSGDEGDQ